MRDPFTIVVATLMLLAPLLIMLALEINGPPAPSHEKWKAAFHGRTPR
jgi:hypothetical protein